MENLDVPVLIDRQASRAEFALFDVRESAVTRRDTPINVYDVGPDDPRAGLAAVTLARLGYGAVRVLAGGLAAWVRAGHARRYPRGYLS